MGNKHRDDVYGNKLVIFTHKHFKLDLRFVVLYLELNDFCWVGANYDSLVSSDRINQEVTFKGKSLTFFQRFYSISS